MEITVCNIAKGRLETRDIDINKENTTWFEDSPDNRGIDRPLPRLNSLPSCASRIPSSA